MSIRHIWVTTNLKSPVQTYFQNWISTAVASEQYQISMQLSLSRIVSIRAALVELIQTCRTDKDTVYSNVMLCSSVQNWIGSFNSFNSFRKILLCIWVTILNDRWYGFLLPSGTHNDTWRKGYLLPTLSAKNNLPIFRLNAPVVIRAKVKKCEQILPFIAMHYWGYMSLEVKSQWGLWR